MTTIAYKDGVIAYDSRLTSGNTIMDDDHCKAYEVEGCYFFMAGSVADIPLFISELVAEEASESWECGGIMVDADGGLWLLGTGKDRHRRTKWDASKPLTVGSGEDFALAALDFGCSAKKAVKYAMTRDCGTGGKVRTFRVRGKR